MNTLILGLGNPILSDDGVGVHAAENVRQAVPFDAAVEIDEASVGGLELLERLLGYKRVILIDALYPGPNHPGTIHRLTLDDLARMTQPQHSASAHDTNLVTAWEMGQQMGLSLPEELIIFAIEVENITQFGATLTPAVAAALPKVTAAVVEALGLSV